MNYNRPYSIRKTVQLMVILTLLAWATQTLFHQWGYGATIGETANRPPPAVKLQMRESSAVPGRIIRLKDVCQWGPGDADNFRELADLPVGRMGPNPVTVPQAQVKSALRDAQVPLEQIELSGAIACRIEHGFRTAQTQPSATMSELELASFRPPTTAPIVRVVEPPAPAPAAMPEQPARPTTHPIVEIKPGDFLTVTIPIGNVKVQTILRAKEPGHFGSVILATNEATRGTHLVTITGDHEATCDTFAAVDLNPN